VTMYATPSDLASFLQKDVDTSTATLVLTKASAVLDYRARTHWGGTVATTYSKPGTGAPELVMPLAPLVAVSAVRVAGVTLTAGSDYTVIEQSVFRRFGFGIPWRYPPDLVEVDYTYGYAAVPDEVVAAVLETAAAAYQSPDISVRNESIDDYSYRIEPNTGGMQLSPFAAWLADSYAGPVAA
jgi:hypothetical protein